jgi:DNA-directed RNA polymerase specialized sigma24 family protein
LLGSASPSASRGQGTERLPSRAFDDAAEPSSPSEHSDEVLAKAYALLPTDLRLVLVLLASEPEMSCTEIAEVLGVPVEAIEPMRLQGLAELRLLAENVAVEVQAR